MGIGFCRSVIAALAAAMLCGAAFADIKAFNAAVTKGDFKAAAATAAETWPTLDKTRPDIDTIAREFGFAAYMAGDYKAAESFAQAAADKLAQTGASNEFAEQTDVLLRMSQHGLAPSSSTRDLLFRALAARIAKPGLDNISYLAVNALVAYDSKTGDWAKVRASEALAINLTTEGGPSMLPDRRKFEVVEAVAAYMGEQKVAQYEALVALADTLLGDMAAADNDKAAQALAPAYWNASAWASTIASHLKERGFDSRVKGIEASQMVRRKAQGQTARVTAALGRDENGGPSCSLKTKLDPFPRYPPSAEFKGYLSTIILQVDVDPEGRSANPKLLASAPLQNFGEVVLKAVPGLTFSPGKTWNADKCKVARSGHVVYFVFAMSR